MFNKKKNQILKLEEELFNANVLINSLKYNVGNLTKDLKDTGKDRDEWRKKYELLYHTPEVKADLEGAFNRGTDYAIAQFKSWLFDAAQNVSVKKGVVND